MSRLHQVTEGSQTWEASHTPDSIFTLTDDGKLQLRPGIQLHMCVSQPPCGDACILADQPQASVDPGSHAQSDSAADGCREPQLEAPSCSRTEHCTDIQTDAPTESQHKTCVDSRTDAGAQSQTDARTDSQTHAHTDALTAARTESQTAGCRHFQADTHTECPGGAVKPAGEQGPQAVRNSSSSSKHRGIASSQPVSEPASHDRLGSNLLSRAQVMPHSLPGNRTGAKLIAVSEHPLLVRNQNSSTARGRSHSPVQQPGASPYEQGQQAAGVLRRKPGRGDATLSMSCSDKLAKWCCIGVQVTCSFSPSSRAFMPLQASTAFRLHPSDDTT